MMKLIVAGLAAPGGHRLHALAVARPIRPAMYCGHILRRAGCDSSAKNGLSHRSKPVREPSSTAIVVRPSVYTDKQESTTIQAGFFNLPK
jgi:hypothetical protein